MRIFLEGMILSNITSYIKLFKLSGIIKSNLSYLFLDKFLQWITLFFILNSVVLLVISNEINMLETMKFIYLTMGIIGILFFIFGISMSIYFSPNFGRDIDIKFIQNIAKNQLIKDIGETRIEDLDFLDFLKDNYSIIEEQNLSNMESIKLLREWSSYKERVDLIRKNKEKESISLLLED